MNLPYTVILAPGALRDLDGISRTSLESIESAMDELSRCRHESSSTKKLAGAENLYRKRVGDYRIIFDVDHNQQLVHVYVVRKRDTVYRR